MGLKSRNKGKLGEREAARELARVLGIQARRGQQFSGGTESPDVVTDCDQLHIEVKRTESLRLYAALDQAITDAGDKTPIVLHRSNRRPWVVIVRLDDLPEVCGAISNSIGCDFSKPSDRDDHARRQGSPDAPQPDGIR